MRRAHDVFHISKLKVFYSDQEGPLDILINNEGGIEQEVLALLGKKKFTMKIYYLVQFVS